jgi:hypothetical protein
MGKYLQHAMRLWCYLSVTLTEPPSCAISPFFTLVVIPLPQLGLLQLPQLDLLQLPQLHLLRLL